MKVFPMSAKLSILIVDGNRTNLALMDMLVRKLPDCATLLQTDPAALLAGVGRIKFDLAVFARHLPQIDGIELARQMKLQPHLKDKPILLTALAAMIGAAVSHAPDLALVSASTLAQFAAVRSIGKFIATRPCSVSMVPAAHTVCAAL